jgi:hypothetical protein
VTVLFGGSPGSGSWSNDTWTWDGNDWTRATPAGGPDGRFRTAMAYDSRRGSVVQLGGCSAGTSGCGGYRDETWEWDGAAWGRLDPVPTAGPRYAHAMSFDGQRRRLVVFGGYPAYPPTDLLAATSELAR